MFSATRRFAVILALGVGFILPAQAASPGPGEIANTQARHIATFFSRENDWLPRRDVVCRLFTPTIYPDGIPKRYSNV